MVKIVFVINALWVGGVEKALINLVNSLDKKKYDITILTIIKDYSLRDQLEPHIKVKGIFPKGLKGVDYVFKHIPVNILYRLFIREKYDIEIAYSDGNPVVLLGLNTISLAKKYTWVHQDISKYDVLLNCYKTWDDYKRSYKSFNKVFCVSGQANQSYKEKVNEDNSCVMYNIVPEKHLKKSAGEPVKPLNNDQLIFTTVGRLSKEKGQLRLLKIHKRLIDDGFAHKLWMIGDGPEKQNILDFIEKNHLRETVILFGFQKNPYKYIAKSDLYICPSYTEALSTTCIESLLLGVPVVTTDVAGSHDILGDYDCGRIVGNSDESLYLELKTILQNPELLKHFRENVAHPMKKFNEKEILYNLETIWG